MGKGEQLARDAGYLVRPCAGRVLRARWCVLDVGRDVPDAEVMRFVRMLTRQDPRHAVTAS